MLRQLVSSTATAGSAAPRGGVAAASAAAARAAPASAAAGRAASLMMTGGRAGSVAAARSPSAARSAAAAAAAAASAAGRRAAFGPLAIAGAARGLASSSSSSSAPSAASAAGAMAAAAEGFGVGRLNHVAIAVPDLKASTALWRDVLGAKVSGEDDLPEHGVTVVFVELGNTKFELLGLLGEKSPIENFLKKNPAGGIHHVCVEVEDIHEGMRAMEAAGVTLLNKEPKIGAHGNPVVFMHPKDMNGVLLELEETGPGARSA